MPPRITRIADIIDETPVHKTFYFADSPSETGEPGQFVMVWIPGVDELPMSLSDMGDRSAVTIEKVGEATSHIFHKKPGDLIGVRGPYGHGFTLKGKHPLFIAGGTGIAPLYPLIKHYRKGDVALGAQTSSHLLFKEKIKVLGPKLHIATDDGSEGFHGTVVELAQRLLETEHNDVIFTCGPEKMMYKVFHLSLDYVLPFEASLERWMKCGVGICDACALDGLHVCKDGPVFDSETLQKITDFGTMRRNPSGKKISIP